MSASPSRYLAIGCYSSGELEAVRAKPADARAHCVAMVPGTGSTSSQPDRGAGVRSARRRAAGALALLLAAQAAGASIVLELTSTSRVEGETAWIELTIVNRGDESAHSLVPTVALGEHADRGEVHGVLDGGEALRRETSLPFTVAGPGSWPGILTVDYADGNGYLLQALQVFRVQVGQPPPGELVVSAIEASEVARRGRVSISLKNQTEAALSAELRVFAPRGLEVDPAPVPVSLDGWGETKVTLPLVNRSALPGSRLPLFAVLEWDGAEAHQTAVGGVAVEVVERSPLLDRYRLLALVGAALLLLAGLVLWLGRRAPRKP